MHCLPVSIYFTLLLYLNTYSETVLSINIKSLSHTSHQQGRKYGLSSVNPVTKPNLRTLRAEGIFGTFLQLLFDTLIEFPTDEKYYQRLNTYIRILSECLYEISNKYTRRLARKLSKLSRKSEYRIKEVIKEYREELEVKVPRRSKFLKAMNSIFKQEQNFLFHDYIRELRKYGKTDKPSITAETRRLLDYVILQRIRRLSSRDRRKLEKKLVKAIKEYKESSESYEKSRSDEVILHDRSTSDYSLERSIKLKEKKYDLKTNDPLLTEYF